MPPEVYYVYRSVSPQQFEKTDNHPRATAFYRRETETSLSVWDAGRVTPRELLERYLSGILPDLQSDDEEKRRKAQNRLNANGATPEAMYVKGWRIVRLSEDNFVAVGLRVLSPRSDGHRDVIGSVEDFVNAALELVEVCEVLTQEETLR